TGEFVLLSPGAGVVLSRVADPGDILGPGVPVAVLGEMAEPWVRVYVPARVLSRIAVGDEVAIYPPGAGGRARSGDSPDGAGSGVISAISSRAEYLNRVALTEEERADLIFGVKVSLPGNDLRFNPGLPVSVRLPLRPAP
ncbi:MAG TPA: HlyD family efflux transporter periplasmic adaptor subunit, partial [Gemmatimonadales bacterium]|nr:HlyD family efflux transporter periplasmic adaptor subunit [Gemmatimonadales bacterium]